MNLSEKEKLENYDEALAKLPTEIQLAKMNAVKSPVTLRRFLSEDAPETLVDRFSTRLNEVTGLRNYEKARVHKHTQEFDKAIAYGHKSLKEGDGRAHLLIGEMTERPEHILHHFKKALEFDDNEDTRNAIGLYRMQEENFKGARLHFEKARDMTRTDKKYYEGLLNILDRKPEEGFAMIEEEAEKGSVKALIFLYLYHNAFNNPQASVKILHKMVKRGFLSGLLELGAMVADYGHYEEAISCYKMAVTAGHIEGYALLLSLLAQISVKDDKDEYFKQIGTLPDELIKGDDKRKKLLHAINSLYEGKIIQARAMVMDAIKEGVHVPDNLAELILSETMEIDTTKKSKKSN